MNAGHKQTKAGRWCLEQHGSSMSSIGLLLVVCCLAQDVSCAYVTRPPQAIQRGFPIVHHAAKQQSSLLKLAMINDDKKQADTPSDIDPLAKASWYAVETFGNLFGTKKKPGEESSMVSLENPPQSQQETLQRIQEDFTRSYFLSGEVDALIYDEQCTFRDPFVAFDGRDRFISNLANLGSFITKYSVRPLEFEEVNPTLVKTKCMVKLELGLPWSPVLAWPWGVEYVIDKDTFLIVDHKETWDIKPIEGVKQIFRKATVSMDGAVSTKNDES